MKHSKQIRISSANEDSGRTEAPASAFVSTIKTSFAKVFRKSRRIQASAALSGQQTRHEPSFDDPSPCWLRERRGQVVSSRSLSFNNKTGWIVITDADLGPGPNDIQLCWLPVEMRGRIFKSHQSMFVIASKLNHQLTIIDFEPMLAMLRGLGAISQNDCL
jgi:hypothetical protein